MSQPFAVCAAVICGGGRVLLARRAPDDPLGPVWEFPGGKVKEGESDTEALRRELEEELGLTAEVGSAIAEARHGQALVRFFECRIGGGRPRGLEGQALLWALPAELPALELAPADRLALAEIARWLEDRCPR